MGKIFLFDEIQKGLVPKPDNFVVAKSQAFDGLQQLVTKGEVVGAMAFGSVAKGSPSERSDFDLLVITPQEPQSEGLGDVIDAVFRNTNVAIEPIVIPEHLASKGMHTIDESFFLHLSEIFSDGNIVGQNPTGILTPFDLPLVKVHEQYLAQKLRRLREGMFTRSEVDRQRVLQRALEAPSNTGRRTLQALHKLGAIDEVLVDDGKPQVTELFRKTFEGTPLLNGFNALLQQDAAYTHLLREGLAGSLTQAEYDRELTNLTNTAIPTALKWGCEIATLYSRLIEGNKITPEGNHPVYRNRERL